MHFVYWMQRSFRKRLEQRAVCRRGQRHRTVGPVLPGRGQRGLRRGLTMAPARGAGGPAGAAGADAQLSGAGGLCADSAGVGDEHVEALARVEEMVRAAAADPARAVSFQGAPGCNGHRAAHEYAPDCLPLPCFSFEDALEAVKDCRAGRAIIPIENSQHGRVADIHFLLPESGLSIVGEHFMSIHHDK